MELAVTSIYETMAIKALKQAMEKGDMKAIEVCKNNIVTQPISDQLQKDLFDLLVTIDVFPLTTENKRVVLEAFLQNFVKEEYRNTITIILQSLTPKSAQLSRDNKRKPIDPLESKLPKIQAQSAEAEILIDEKDPIEREIMQLWHANDNAGLLLLLGRCTNQRQRDLASMAFSAIAQAKDKK